MLHFESMHVVVSGERPYVCTIPGCGKRFTEYSSLYKHHVVHTHSKPYACPHCGKTYRYAAVIVCTCSIYYVVFTVVTLCRKRSFVLVLQCTVSESANCRLIIDDDVVFASDKRRRCRHTDGRCTTKSRV